jgi:hypothetical protein
MRDADVSVDWLQWDSIRGLRDTSRYSPTVVWKTNVTIKPKRMVVIPISRKRNLKGLKEQTLFN